MNEQFENFLKALRSLPVIGDIFDNRPKVAVIRLSGVIADAGMRRQGISHSRYSQSIEKAFEKSGVCAVALALNSPGGSAAQSSLVAGLVRQLAAEKNIPVFAFVEDVAASGGYWLACAADEIYAQETSIVGSIGVISAGFGFEDFIERHGIQRRMHTSGTEKSFLDPFLPERKEDLARLETIQKDIHESFKDWVRSRRGDKLKGDDKALFDGRFWTAVAAVDKGLIDGIGDIRSTMRERFGDKVKFVDCSPEKKLPFPLSILSSRLEKASLGDDVLEALETKALWSRYGL